MSNVTFSCVLLAPEETTKQIHIIIFIDKHTALECSILHSKILVLILFVTGDYATPLIARHPTRAKQKLKRILCEKRK